MRSVVTPAQWRAQPWRNGAGVTHEVLRLPADGNAFELRISVADVVAPGAFSSFAGYRRWLTLLDGGPIELLLDGATHRLVAPGDMVTFDGGAPAAATVVERAGQDLNVMVRSTREADVTLLRGPSAASLVGDVLAVFVLAGEVELGSHLLPARHTAWSSDDARWQPRVSAHGLAVGVVLR